MADGIVREFENGFKAGLCIEHLPHRKKPVLVATMGITRFKVAEITDERGLREVCKLLFSEVKGVE